MKKWTKRFLYCAMAGIMAFALISISCAKLKVSGSAETTFANGTMNTAYAETPARNTYTPAEALSIVEALQTSFRYTTEKLLPSVVEVDVTETKTYTNPMRNFGWPFGDFFGNSGDDGKREYETKGLGSGVIVRRADNKLYVLTNNHVAGGATKISIKLNDGREFEGKLVGADERMDIALVSFESDDKSIPVAVLGDSDLVRAGDICMAFGAPLGYSQSVTQGIVSATGRSETQMSNISDFIQTDAAINQGNSGGPLVNIYGEVIGINTWIASSSGGSQGLGFAIPINNIKSTIDSFIKNGKVAYGWLGVSLLEVNSDFKKELGVEKMDGAFAAEIFTGSPADKGGIKPGDYIVELNGKKVKSVNQLVRDVGYLEAGKTAKFVVIRGGKKLPEISVKIEERAQDVDSQNNKLWPGFIASVLTSDVRKSLKIDDDNVKGVVVSNIEAKSPAASLRMQNGDVITAVNGKSVTNVAEFYAELAAANKSINFDLYSNGGTITTGTFKF
ncbi:MAG: Do family serine endopeptidase [Treponema sp.]|nr:Do family serine endopeptidase [Treponema sp.]